MTEKDWIKVTDKMPELNWVKEADKIIADKIELCGAKDSAPSQSPAPSPAPARPQYQTTPIVDDLPYDDTGLPF